MANKKKVEASASAYPPELVKKYGLLKNGKLNIGLADLAQMLERKAEKEGQ